VKLSISHNVLINRQITARNGVPLVSLSKKETSRPEDLYIELSYNYPKFFKMDILCKWAWISAEYLLKNNDEFLYNGLQKDEIGVVLASSHGCLDVDKKYSNTITNFPSPALFVYTLPNIMLGEICIRHGFKGEQTCLISERFDTDELCFWVNDLIENRGMKACICGWVDIADEEHDICLFWVTKNENGLILSPATMQKLYKN